MLRSYEAVILTFILIAAAFAAMIISRRRTEKLRYIKMINDSWGKKGPRLFSASEPSGVRAYSDDMGEDIRYAAVDEITASDVDLMGIYGELRRTMSSAGDEVLYAWLRHPLTDRRELERRIRMEECFLTRSDIRVPVMTALGRAGHLKGDSYYSCLKGIRDAQPHGKGKFIALAAVTAAALIMLFIYPLAAVIMLVPILAADFHVHLSMKNSERGAIRGFMAAGRLLQCGNELLRVLPGDGMEAEASKMKELISACQEIRKGSQFVMSGGSVGTGLGDALIEYVNLLFHFDHIFFDSMLERAKKHERDLIELFVLTGEIDAAACAASWSVSRDLCCRPAFDEKGDVVRISVTDMVHPLIAEPVPNTLCTEDPILLTGSNASGKSTFLKSIAVSAILAQSIGFVTATSYRAPMLRIMSSMALTDNLRGGESYFVVEIRSLKRILDAAEGETPVLALVDEVLRGTNTIERIAASSRILMELARRNTIVFAATHDIELTGLTGNVYRNMHFQETAADGDVRFDYVLKEGRAEAGNAIALLRTNGYPVAVTEGAEGAARHFEETGEWT
ncbi:MAG: hypothetical protein Q4G47_02385 [Lachnospiraceae bacterium]|nr:hypothetical protein [Lachnospiraceae bacterium]